jgi:hypothetical protein
VKVEAKELVEEVGGTGPTSRSERPIAQGGPHNRFFEELQRHL